MKIKQRKDRERPEEVDLTKNEPEENEEEWLCPYLFQKHI
jgi:hypothetical protein